MNQINHSSRTSSKKENRNIYFKMRVTPEQDEQIRKHAKEFHGISSYIRAAVAEYSNPQAKEVDDFMYDLYQFYFDYGYEISTYGSSLNQSATQVNELAKAGKLKADDIQHSPLSAIKLLHGYLVTLSEELDAVIERAQKSGIQI